MKKSRIASPVSHAESPLRHLPLVDLLVDTKTELLELALRSGLKVFTAMLEEDRTAICGPRYAHEPERPAQPRRHGAQRSRAGRPEGRHPAPARARRRPARSPLPTFQAMAATDPLESARRRADARGRRDAAVRAEPGAGPAGDARAAARARARSAAASSRGRRRSSRPGRVRRSTASTWSRC